MIRPKVLFPYLAAAAYRQTESVGYSAGAVLGRIRPVASLGEVAQSMGVLAPDQPLALGLYAGQRSTQSLRAGRWQISADAQRPDAEGANAA